MTSSAQIMKSPELMEIIRTLKLHGMAQALERELQRAETQGLSHPELLQGLLEAEAHHRREQSLKWRIQQAKLPWDWTLQSFPFSRQPGVRKSQIMSLAGLQFIERADNLVFIGEPGTGKSGLAIGLMREALANGYRGRFYKAQDLLDEIYASIADRSTPRLIRKLARYPLLVIDELGYLTLKPEQANAFFNLMDERYAKTSTVITTNLPYSEWYGLFHRKSLVDALLDRLKHHCITIEIQGPSLRTSQNENEPS